MYVTLNQNSPMFLHFNHTIMAVSPFFYSRYKKTTITIFEFIIRISTIFLSFSVILLPYQTSDIKVYASYLY